MSREQWKRQITSYFDEQLDTVDMQLILETFAHPDNTVRACADCIMNTIRKCVKNAIAQATFTEDAKPYLVYRGRKIEIQSDGTGQGTTIVIDGVKQKTVKEMDIRLRATKIVQVFMVFLDLAEDREA